MHGAIRAHPCDPWCLPLSLLYRAAMTRPSRRAFSSSRAISVSKDLAKRRESFGEQLVGDAAHRDAEGLEGREAGAFRGEVGVRGAADDAVVAEGDERRRRHRVHGLGGDERLDVDDVAIARGSSCSCSPRAAAARARRAAVSAAHRGPSKRSLNSA